MGPYIVGFDPLGYYIPYTLIWLKGGASFLPFIGQAPLFYALLIGITSVGIPIVLTMKILAPLLLGLLGLAVYFYANKTLSWSPQKSLITVLFSTLYFVALRVSWDMFRSEIALIFLFLTLYFLEKRDHPFRNAAFLAITMSLVVLSHLLVATIMFAIVIVTILHSFLRKNTQRSLRVFFSSIPAAIVFLAIVYVGVALSQYSIVNGLPASNSGALSISFGLTSSIKLATDTLGFLAFCYLPLLPLAIARKKLPNALHMKVWILFLTLLLLIVFVSSHLFFDVLPYRLILLLIYPLAFYAVEAFSALRLNKLKIGIALVLATLTIGFAILPYNTPLPYFDLYPGYVPKSMLMNTIPLNDCKDTVNVLQWARNSLPNNSRLLVNYAFYGWAALNLNDKQFILYGFENANIAAQELHESGATYSLYLIWWINSSGWFGQPPLSSNYEQIYSSGNIAIFNYTSANNTKS
jgi:hypothetical protein